MAVVGEAQDRASAVPLATAEQPDIILLDLDLGRDNGIDFIAELLATAPGAKVLVLTGVGDTASLRRAIHKGAMGLVHKACAADVLIRAIERVHAGEVWLDRSMIATVLTELSRGAEERAERAPGGDRPLTKREREVISYLAEGLNNKGSASACSSARRRYATISPRSSPSSTSPIA